MQLENIEEQVVDSSFCNKLGKDDFPKAATIIKAAGFIHINNSYEYEKMRRTTYLKEII